GVRSTFLLFGGDGGGLDSEGPWRELPGGGVRVRVGIRAHNWIAGPGRGHLSAAQYFPPDTKQRRDGRRLSFWPDGAGDRFVGNAGLSLRSGDRNGPVRRIQPVPVS